MESGFSEQYQFQLSIQNQALEKLNQGSSLKAIMDLFTEGFESQFSKSKCSVLLLDKSGQHLHNCSAPSLPETYLKKIDGIPIGPNAGSCGTAAFRKEIVVVEDIDSDPLWKRGKNLALRNNLQSCWSFPIFGSKENVLGTFAVYHSKPSKPRPVELDFISSFAKIAGISIDSKSTQKSLKDSEERFRAIMTQAVDAFIVHDLHGKIVDVNDQACKNLGYSRKELLGLSVPDIEMNFNAKKVPLKWQEVADGKHFEIEGLHRRKDGSVFPVEVHIGLIKMDDGNYILATIRDITERKKIEEELANHRNDLESLVTQRTSDLEKAKQKAEKANQAKSEFLSLMSHELKTPLNAILGFAELIMVSHNKPSNKTPENAQYILNSGKHLLGIVNELLDLAQIERGVIKLNNEVLSIKPEIDSLVNSLRPLAKKLGITIVNQIPELPNHTIYADMIRFNQILLNLISNAIKYNRNNGFITIGLRNIDDSNLRIFVMDTGIGIPEKEQDLIFEPFNRFTKDPRIEGTGVGLYITKLLVEAMDGSISLESEENQGSTFFVSLPKKEKAS
jgi:PAS domain S-box-containing protein